MRLILFGATGMVGQGVLREALADATVTKVLTVGRKPVGQTHAKLEDLVCPDLFDLSAVEQKLTGYDACAFCLGVSAGGLSEAEYTRITHDLTVSVGATLVRLNPDFTFIYVSGSGTDDSGKGRAMWARVKGQTERDLAAMPFRGAYFFRPAYIQPLDGIVSHTPAYRWMYAVAAPLYPVWKRLFPKHVTTTRKVGRAMLKVAKDGAPQPVLENDAVNRLAGEA